MNEKICNYVFGCPIYAHFQQNEMQDCMRQFCLGDYESCERRNRRTKGLDVPPDLMPDGCFMEMPEEAADEQDQVTTPHKKVRTIF